MTKRDSFEDPAERPDENFSIEPPLFGNLYFSHLNPLLNLASKRHLDIEDLGTLPEGVDPLNCYQRFKDAWKAELTEKGLEEASLYRATLEVVGPWRVVLVTVLNSVCGNAVFAVPLLQEAIVKSQDGTSMLSTEVLWTLIALTLVIPVCITITSSRAQSKSFYFELHLQSALRMAIHAKILTVGPIAQKDYSIGEITTFFQRDVGQASQLTTQVCNLCTCSLQVLVGLMLVYNIFGLATLACLGIVLVNYVLSFYLARMQQRAFREYQKHSAKRLKMMSEVLVGVRSIKYNSWEKAFLRCIQALRGVELGKLLRYQFLQLPANVLGLLAPVSMPVIVFFVYIQQGHSMTFVQAFTALMIFQSVTGAISELPGVLNGVIEAIESFRRIKTFLVAPDLQNYVHKAEGKAGSEGGGAVAAMEGASLGWDYLTPTASTSATADPKTAPPAAEREALIMDRRDKDSDTDVDSGSDASKQADALNRSIHTLRGVDMTVERGQLVAIVGAVGSGKTSLLTAFLGEMVLHGFEAGAGAGGGRSSPGSSGVTLTGSVAYHQQQPWIFNATLRENILFGRPYDSERFERVVASCALQQDIDSIPNGVDTEIGERGINLSGGQKARVSFARALYRDADVYLLDDPLSAVDAGVAHTIVHRALLAELRARGKTVLLVTHQVHFLPLFDKVLVLDGGSVAYEGKYSDMDKRLLPIIDKEQQGQGGKEKEKKGEDEEKKKKKKSRDAGAAAVPMPMSPSPTRQALAAGLDANGNGKGEGKGGRTNGPNHGTHTRRETGEDEDKHNTKGKGKGEGEGKAGDKGRHPQLMRTEGRSRGSVQTDVYLYYLRGGGLGLFGLVLLMLAANVTLAAMANYTIIDWSEEEGASAAGTTLSTQRNMYYVNLYAVYAMMNVAAYGLAWLLRIVITQTGARFFHYHLAEIMLKAPISFYDTSPLGRILTLFSNDLRSMNVMLFAMVEKTCFSGLRALCSVVVISEATSGIFLIIAVPLVVLVYQFQVYYRACNTEVSRITARSFSPLMVEFAAQLSALPSLRAYDAVPGCVDAIRRKIIVCNTATFMKTNIKLWLLMRLNTVGSAITFFCIVAQVVTRGYISTADLSIAILYAQLLPALLQGFLFQSSQLEASMASAERFKMAADSTPQEGLTLRHLRYTLKQPGPGESTEHEDKDKDKDGDGDGDGDGKRVRKSSFDSLLPSLSPSGRPRASPTEAVPSSSYGRDRDSVLRRAGGLVLRDVLCCAPGQPEARRDREWWEDLPEGVHVDIGVVIPPASWPADGALVVRDLQMRYRDGPLVLKGLSFGVKRRETIGIVGRTGSGKSSLMVSLFGIERPHAGTITIDGVDIARVPLPLLRSRLGIVLQDSVMFSNTLRFNIDPFEEYSDERIWTVLRDVGLGPMMEGLAPAGLATRVEEGGSNFSQGQRQLITFCRALLKAPSVLLLDEATASLDDEADKRVQDLLLSAGAEAGAGPGARVRTQIAIAHRLHSVRHADRVLVMRDGSVGEYGPPDGLLAHTDTAAVAGNAAAIAAGSGAEEEGDGIVYPPPSGMFRELWSQYLANQESD